MQPSRVSRGEAIAAAGGLLLLVLMFVNWFDGTLEQFGTPIGVQPKTGWQSFGGVLDFSIIGLALLPVGIAVAKATDRLPRLPLEQSLMVLGAGLLLLLIVGWRLIDAPDLADVAIPNADVDIVRKKAAFLALLAAAAVAAGGHLQRRESVASRRQSELCGGWDSNPH